MISPLGVAYPTAWVLELLLAHDGTDSGKGRVTKLGYVWAVLFRKRFHHKCDYDFYDCLITATMARTTDTVPSSSSRAGANRGASSGTSPRANSGETRITIGSSRRIQGGKRQRALEALLARSEGPGGWLERLGRGVASKLWNGLEDPVG